MEKLDGFVRFESLEDMDQHLNSLPHAPKRMKGRRYKSIQRSNVKFEKDQILRCKCGRDTKEIKEYHLCKFKNCVQFTCEDCGRIDAGWGPVGCPCDIRGLLGHGRYDEQPKPTVRKKWKSKYHASFAERF